MLITFVISQSQYSQILILNTNDNVWKMVLDNYFNICDFYCCGIFRQSSVTIISKISVCLI